MGALYTTLFWFITVTTAISGGLGFLLKLPGFYKPDAYLINGRPATGTTPFEQTATFVFALVYLTPLVGMAYAHVEGSAGARRAAALVPLAYHAASVFGVLFVFPHDLNPAVAPLAFAAAIHAAYAGLCGALFWAAGRR